jgi:hypothetical protein
MVSGLTNRGGRPLGTPNRVGVIVKEAILAAFDRVGGVAYLEQVARQEPKAFCTLLAKLVPKNETPTPIATLEMSDHALNDRLAALLRDSGVSREVVSTGESVDAEVVSVLRSPTE